jgi:hypothetical protein
MASPAERLLLDLGTRLEESDSLTASTRHALRDGDVSSIDLSAAQTQQSALSTAAAQILGRSLFDYLG